MQDFEIERRWLISGFPEAQGLACLKRAAVRQGYIATAPTVRIRESIPENGTPSYVLCFKGKGQLARTEVELPLTKAEFDRLAVFTGRDLVTKRFRVYALPGGERLEVSLVDEGRATSFYYAEVEFDSEDEANAFAPPPFLGEEKTHDASFSMSSYWRRTRGEAASAT